MKTLSRSFVVFDIYLPENSRFQLSLSLSTCIYIYLCVCVHVCAAHNVFCTTLYVVKVARFSTIILWVNYVLVHKMLSKNNVGALPTGELNIYVVN